MAYIERTPGCCGVRQLVDLWDETPREIIKRVKDGMNDGWDAAYYMFADNSEEGNGRKLARYIRDNKLGGLTKIGPRFNPNSENYMTVWLWAVNRDKLTKHLGKYAE